MTRTKVRNAPPVPGKVIWIIGLAGLLPFLGGAVAAFVPAMTQAVDAARLYALLILCFLGGSHWGFNVRHNRALLLVLSVLPVLIGWAASLTLNRSGEALALAFAFAATQLLDEYQTEAGYLHSQYRLLRRMLTGVAVICLLCMAVSKGL